MSGKNKISDSDNNGLLSSSSTSTPEGWTKDLSGNSSTSATSSTNSNGKSTSTRGEDDEEIVQLLLSSKYPSSAAGASPRAMSRRQLQVVPVGASSRPKSKSKSSSPKDDDDVAPGPPSPSNNNNHNHAGVKKKKPNNLTIVDPNSKSRSAVAVVDIDDDGGIDDVDPDNSTSSNPEQDTITSPTSLSFFRSFLQSSANNNNTLTLTSIDSRFKQKFSSKFGKIRKRIVYKNGECNLHSTNVSKRRRRYLADIYTTLVDIQWRWTLISFAMSFIGSWLCFAVVWWIIAFRHGDFEEDHLPDQQETSGWRPCIFNMYSFTSAFLFSIETQHTIGYGSRYTTEECPDAIIVMVFQSILGVMIQAMTVGIIFAKLSRPKKRTQTIVFSRHGVICERDGDLCLMFRVGDMRKSHIISATVRAQLIKRKTTQEGEVLPYYQYNLDVSVDDGQTTALFIWPMIVVHRITKTSPLYNLSAEEILNERFEIVLILEGVIETTGASTQARTSYLPSEILWGHRFEPLVTFQKDVLQYSVNYSLFNRTYEVETPLCSAKELDVIKAAETEDRADGNGSKLLSPFRAAIPPRQKINLF